jgi:hypothetical protein
MSGKTGKGSRQDNATNWLCRACKAHDGTRYINFSSRDRCNKCNIDQWSCFHSNVGPHPPAQHTRAPAGRTGHERAPASLAERQVKAERTEAKGKTKLEKQNKKLALQLSKAQAQLKELVEAKGAACPTQGEALDDDTPSGQEPTDACTDEELTSFIEVLRRSKSGENHAEWPAYQARLQNVRMAKMADKPLHVQLAKATKVLAQREAQVGSKQAAVDRARQGIKDAEEALNNAEGQLAKVIDAVAEAKGALDNLKSSIVVGQGLALSLSKGSWQLVPASRTRLWSQHPCPRRCSNVGSLPALCPGFIGLQG